jgi:hypothetical protein
VICYNRMKRSAVIFNGYDENLTIKNVMCLAMIGNSLNYQILNSNCKYQDAIVLKISFSY